MFISLRGSSLYKKVHLKPQPNSNILIKIFELHQPTRGVWVPPTESSSLSFNSQLQFVVFKAAWRQSNVNWTKYGLPPWTLWSMQCKARDIGRNIELFTLSWYTTSSWWRNEHTNLSNVIIPSLSLYKSSHLLNYLKTVDNSRYSNNARLLPIICQSNHNQNTDTKTLAY